MDLTSFPYRQKAIHAVPWALYKEEKGLLLAESESPEDYLPYHDMAAYVESTGDESLWRLLVQDVIKEMTAIVILEDFHDHEDLKQACGRLRVLLSLHPKHRLTKDLLCDMDTEGEGLLFAAARTVARWHERIACEDSENQTRRLKTLPPVDYCLHVYPPAIRTAIVNLRRILAACDDFFDGAYLHGSLATLDFIPGASDLDLVYVLNEDTSANAYRLLQVRKRLRETRNCFYMVDPFQHHGPYVVTPKIKANYVESYLPLAVWKRARPILGPDEVQMSVRQSPFHRRLWFRKSVQYYRRSCIENRHPESVFDAKLLTSMASMLPAVAQTHVAGVYTDKSSAVVWLKNRFPEEFILHWLDRITRIRSGAHFTVNPSGPICCQQPDKTSKVGGELQSLLTVAPYMPLAEVCDHILGVRNPARPYGRFKRLSNWPQRIRLKRYDQLTDKMARHAASIPSVTRLCTTGNVRTPGISDLDFLVVTGDGFSPTAIGALNGLYECLDDDEKSIIMHDPMAIVPESLVPDLPFLFPLAVRSTPLGESAVFHALPLDVSRWLALIHLTDLAIAMNGRLFHEMLLREEIDVRLLLNQLGGLKYSIRLFKLAGGQPMPFEPLIQDIETVRNQWFQHSASDRLPGLLDQGIDLVNSLNDSIHALWKRQPVFPPGTFAFRTPSTCVDFTLQEAFGCHVEAGEIVMHLPPVFACTLLHYASQEGPLSQFLRRNLVIPPMAQHGQLGWILTHRARQLNRHFSYLLSNGLKRGFFAPFHFGWQLWKEKQRDNIGRRPSAEKSSHGSVDAMALPVCM